MELATPFLREGLMGAIIVVLAGVIVYQNRKLDVKDRFIYEILDKRVGDANQFTTNFTTVAKDMVATNKDLINQNAILQKGVDTMAQALQTFVTTFREVKV